MKSLILSLWDKSELASEPNTNLSSSSVGVLLNSNLARLPLCIMFDPNRGWVVAWAPVFSQGFRKDGGSEGLGKRYEKDLS